MASLRPALLVLVFCVGCTPKPDEVEDLNTQVITLPAGGQIRAQVVLTQGEMESGMKFRDALPQGRGMLFVYRNPAPYVYWMSNVKVPLDIIFMDSSHRIVEIAAGAPPCNKKPADCPVYGGHTNEQFVLELRAGEAQRLGVQQGQTLTF
ncbi:MAG TPA: DUF192 domain-containing protein [Bryobacteraceae bacterium]|jgi:uncharacterized protein|nr:DUF192 domain-containing protein [Bryobacteraceae bacterium]